MDSPKDEQQYTEWTKKNEEKSLSPDAFLCCYVNSAGTARFQASWYTSEYISILQSVGHSFSFNQKLPNW